MVDPVQMVTEPVGGYRDADHVDVDVNVRPPLRIGKVVQFASLSTPATVNGWLPLLPVKLPSPRYDVVTVWGPAGWSPGGLQVATPATNGCAVHVGIAMVSTLNATFPVGCRQLGRNGCRVAQCLAKNRLGVHTTTSSLWPVDRPLRACS